MWSSDAVSVPVSAFGRVSMLHSALDYFWCDMSIYPGNSGGPVIENDKLVGIVSAQALISTEAPYETPMRIPFGRIMKAKHLKPLMDRQRGRKN